MKIDLNSDLGEGYGPWRMGEDEAMMGLVASANIACGGHAGDPETMAETSRLALSQQVTIGAHPGYADREGFGRRIIPMTPDEITRLIAAQTGALQGVAAVVGAKVRYIKPHGALSNFASADPQAAHAVVAAAKALDLALLAISGTEMERAAKAAGVETFAEIFADRAYLPNGQLVPRSRKDAVIHDPDLAAERLLRFIETGLMPTVGGDPVRLRAQSICVHGDNPAAVAMTRHLRDRLTAAGITIAPFLT